jgi:positive regulator of sigma E activity
MFDDLVPQSKILFSRILYIENTVFLFVQTNTSETVFTTDSIDTVFKILRCGPAIEAELEIETANTARHAFIDFL